jgi:hypothetical protein
MLDELLPTFSEDTIFIVDCNAKMPHSLSNFDTQLKIPKDLERFDEERFDEGQARLREIESLSQINPTILLSEVSREISWCINSLKNKMAIMADLVRNDGNDPRHYEILKLFRQYTERMIDHRRRLEGLDPRDPLYKDSLVPNLPRKESNLYIGSFIPVRNTLKEVLRMKRKKQRGIDTDAHIVTVAEMLNQKEHAVCVLTEDPDIIDVLEILYYDMERENIHGTNGKGINLHSASLNGPISIYNPNGRYI